VSPRIEFVSPSKLKSFRACPRRAFEEPYTESDATKFGSALHVGAASLAAGRSMDEACGAFAGALHKSDPNMATEENANRAADALHAIVENKRLALDPDAVIAIESEDAKTGFSDGSKKYHEVPIGSNWGLRVMIDLVDTRDGRLRIVDWKSGQSEEDDDIQNACYALASARLYPGFAEIETGYFYAEQGKAGWYDGSTWDAEALKAAEEYIGGLVRDYLEEKRAKKRDERMNKKCGWCALRTTCTTYQERTKVIPTGSSWNVAPTVETFPTILAYLEQIAAIRKASEDIESELTKRRNAVLAEHGVIEFDGRTYTRTEKVSRYDYPTKELFDEAARILGRAPLECVAWDNGTADDVMKKEFPKRGDATRKAWDEFVKAHRTVKSKSVGVKVMLAHELPAPAGEEAKQE
jgi:hypothetical protein